jgi:hypothetical protein
MQNHARLLSDVPCAKGAKGFFAAAVLKNLFLLSCTVYAEHILHDFLQVQMFLI